MERNQRIHFSSGFPAAFGNRGPTLITVQPIKMRQQNQLEISSRVLYSPVLSCPGAEMIATETHGAVAAARVSTGQGSVWPLTLGKAPVAPMGLLRSVAATISTLLLGLVLPQVQFSPA